MNKNNPILLLENIYISSEKDHCSLDTLCRATALEFSEQLGVPLYGQDSGGKDVAMFQSAAPPIQVFTTDLDFDYEDSDKAQIQKGESITASDLYEFKKIIRKQLT